MYVRVNNSKNNSIRRVKKFVSLIIILLLSSFSTNAYTCGSVSDDVIQKHGIKLGPRSIFNRLSEPQIRDIKILEYWLKCHAEVDPSIIKGQDKLPDELIAEIGPGISLSVNFKNTRALTDSAFLCPCRIRDNDYYALFVRDPGSGSGGVTVLTKEEVDDASSDPGIVAASSGTRHENDLIEALNRRVAVGISDRRVRNVIGFLSALGAKVLADNVRSFIGNNRFFVINGQDDVPARILDHASDRSIYLKSRTSPEEFEKALLKQVLVKAGLRPGEDNFNSIVAAVSEGYGSYLRQKSEFDPAPTLQAVSLRSEAEIALRTQGFTRATALVPEPGDCPAGHSDIDEAIIQIRTWKGSSEQELNSASDKNPFTTRLQDESVRIYNEYKIYQMPLGDRIKYARAVFDGRNFPEINGYIGLILERLSIDEKSTAELVSPVDYQIVTDMISRIRARESLLNAKNLYFAVNTLVFNLSAKERRVLELCRLVEEIENEQREPGLGDLPLIAAMQDLHGGQRRASALIGFALGLGADAYGRISTPLDLQREVEKAGISIEDMDVRFAGLNDKYDRGRNPVQTCELVKWLDRSRRLKPFIGNHDLWRCLGVLGVHKYFEEKGIDWNSPENKNHHIGFWSSWAFGHAGWGDIEIDQINESRVNAEIARVNATLRSNGSEPLEKVDLAGYRYTRLQPEIKRLKKLNAQIRQENELHKGDPQWERKQEHKLPDIIWETAGFLREEIEKRNEVIRRVCDEKKLSIGEISPGLVGPDNFQRDPEIIERALWDLKAFRLFYVDILGNLHIHNALPLDYKTRTIDVRYKGLSGLAALELIQEDIRHYFEGMTTIPDTPEFREQLWRDLGEALTIVNGFFSDRTATSKPVAVKQFVEAGGLKAFHKDFFSWPMQDFSARPVSFMMIMGHNEWKKFDANRGSKTPLPWINLFPGAEGGVGLALIDQEMSEAHANRGGILTIFKRDDAGKLTGLRLWGYPGPDSGVVEDLTFSYAKGMSAEQAELLKTLADGGRFLEFLRRRLVREIYETAGALIRTARDVDSVNIKVDKLTRIKAEASAKLEAAERAERANKGSPARALTEIASGLVSGLNAAELKELIDRVPELNNKDSQTPMVKAKILRVLADKIHFINLGITRKADKDKKTTYVIPRSLIPESQWAVMEMFRQHLEKIGSPESIVLVDSENSVVAEANRLNDGTRSVLVATADADDFTELNSLNIKTLKFGGKVGDFRQLEGMLAALRAYNCGDFDALKDIYRVLTGRMTPSDAGTIESFTRAVVFILPPITSLDYDQVKELNEALLKFMKSA